MKVLVLLHGWGVRPSVFDTLRAQLAEWYEVRAPALPGYDGTAACEPYNVDTLADRLAAAAPERCFVAGWSLGGEVALAWAGRAPQQVERFALIATSPCFVRREGWISAMDPEVLGEFSAALDVDASRTLKRFSLLQAQGDSRQRDVALVCARRWRCLRRQRWKRCGPVSRSARRRPACVAQLHRTAALVISREATRCAECGRGIPCTDVTYRDRHHDPERRSRAVHLAADSVAHALHAFFA